jgi:hypothetical protein
MLYSKDSTNRTLGTLQAFYHGFECATLNMPRMNGYIRKVVIRQDSSIVVHTRAVIHIGLETDHIDRHMDFRTRAWQDGVLMM